MRGVQPSEVAGRLDVTQGAVSKLERTDDVRVSALCQYLNALGARLELVAVSDNDFLGRRSTLYQGVARGVAVDFRWRASVDVSYGT